MHSKQKFSKILSNYKRGCVMPKKEWTDAERKAFGEKMRAARAAKTSNTEETVKSDKKTVEIPEDKLNYILEELNRLKQQQPAQPLQQATVTNAGVQGTTEKYSTNKNLYSDPRERLFNEPEFQRFAIKDNYSMYWDILITRYQTAQGLWFQEPRFELELRRKDLDEEGNVKREYVIQKLVAHEDFDAAIDIAKAVGVEIDDSMSKEFIDEMRYQTFKMWLKELFFPPKTIQQVNNGRTEAVIGGTVVTVYENPSDLNRHLSGV